MRTLSVPQFLALRGNCRYSVFFRIWTEYGEILRIFPYSVLMRKNKDQNSSEDEHFLRNAGDKNLS